MCSWRKESGGSRPYGGEFGWISVPVTMPGALRALGEWMVPSEEEALGHACPCLANGIIVLQCMSGSKVVLISVHTGVPSDKCGSYEAAAVCCLFANHSHPSF